MRRQLRARRRAAARERAPRAAVSAVLLAVLTASCTDDRAPAEREYALPDTLCGLRVEQALYEGLFPPGRRLEVSGGRPGTTWLSYCTVSVDDETVLRFDIGQSDGRAPDMYLLAWGDEYEMRDGKMMPAEYETVVWPHAAVARGTCDNRGTDTRYPQDATSHSIVLETFHPQDDEESARILSYLITPIVDADRDELGCRGTAPGRP
ncbi:hypothetical protein ACL02R_15140 [Streptomyces sp. MS19]|uniref:hypothetical protein n=1 Tax=Streptomyces sp. MS19 TaxID=3385972 RepID=UPI0039A3B1EB